MPVFPLATKVESYKTVAPCKFGYEREISDPALKKKYPNMKRKHAGCDLGIAAGTDVFAVEDGEVVEVSGGFKENTSIVSISHFPDGCEEVGFAVRYGEVDNIIVKVGALVKKGEKIAVVGKQTGGTQLHLEMYSDTVSGSFRTDVMPYMRRADLIDPTNFLDEWEVK